MDNTNEVIEMDLHIFANDPSPQHQMLLEMFYNGAFTNTLGVMEALDSDTGKLEKLIVGVDAQGNAYPLAQCLGPEDTKKYLAPDGAGGYHNSPAEKASLDAIN